MFSIYKNGSVGFRSSADNLYEIKNTEAPHRADLKPDDDTLFQELLNNKDHKDGNSNSQGQKQSALNTYKKMANIDTSEEIYHVEDIMTRDFISVLNSNTLKDAYDTLKEKQINQIPILTPEGKITGMINKKIILNLLIEDLDNSKEILEKTLEDLYLPELITTHPITDIRRVSKVMLDFKLDAVPVVKEDDIIVGIVSKTDIIKAVSHMPHLKLYS